MSTLVAPPPPQVPRRCPDHLGVPTLRGDLGMRRDGCCSMCGGGGMSGEECTSGHCWDCQGTGHPHLGPCGRWEAFGAWCHRHELDALLLILIVGWVGTFGLAFVPDAGREIAVAVLGGLLVLGLAAWVTMSRLGDRQMKRERERSRA